MNSLIQKMKNRDNNLKQMLVKSKTKLIEKLHKNKNNNNNDSNKKLINNNNSNDGLNDDNILNDDIKYEINNKKFSDDLNNLLDNNYDILFIPDDVLSKISTYLSLIDSLRFGFTCQIINGIIMNRSSSIVSLSIDEIYRITKWYEYSKHYLDNFANYFMKKELDNHMNKILKKYSNIQYILFNIKTDNIIDVNAQLSSRFVFTLFPKLKSMKSYKLSVYTVYNYIFK